MFSTMNTLPSYNESVMPTHCDAFVVVFSWRVLSTLTLGPANIKRGLAGNVDSDFSSAYPPAGVVAAS